MTGDNLIEYRSKPARLALFACYLSMPLWTMGSLSGLIAVVAVFAFKTLTKHCDLALCTSTAYSLILLSAIFLTGSMITKLLQEKAIKVFDDGLEVPILMSISNNFERFVEWQEIEKVLLKADVADNQEIQFSLPSGRISIGLNGLTPSGLEQLLMNITSFVRADIIDPAIFELKDQLWNLDSQNLEGAAPGYTQLWHEELAGRYAATAYIPLTPGHRLRNNSLKVIRHLALGGWSAVYTVQENNTLKILKESVIPPGSTQALKDKAEAMFIRESKLLMNLDHNQIVHVYEHFFEDNRHYLLMENIGGQTFKQLVTFNGPLHQLDVLDYASQMTDILNYLHDRQPPILHRDFTPDNLILDASGVVHLIDFGAANEMLSSATGTMVGKQNYIAKEQFQGHATPASDLYALGATMHFMLTGQEPRPMLASSPANINPRISPELNKIVEALTAQDLSEKPSSANQLKELLLAVSNKRVGGIKQESTS